MNHQENLRLAHERANRLGRQLNAVVATFHAPLREPIGPLLGLPIAVKDIMDIAGHPRGNGNPTAMASPPAVTDSVVVESLRSAGANVFAATSLLEYAAGATHPDVPEALNPYNLKRTAGGSSGGSAALVGVGACSVALGTDTGGSIRIPAHYCGTVGFKPSYGALSLQGVEPLAPTLDHVGLLTDKVSTANRVFRALTGAPVGDAGVSATGPLSVGVIIDQLTAVELESDVATAVQGAVETLRSAGCSIVEVDGSVFSQLRADYSDILLFEAWQAHRDRATSHPGRYGPETLRLLRAASGVSRGAYESALARRQRSLHAAGRVYDGIDVLLSPACPFVAPTTTPPSDTPQGNAEGMFTAIFNLTGDPALVLPCGWSTDGLPIGVQISSPLGTDTTLLAAAAYIEAVLAVPVRAPVIQ